MIAPHTTRDGISLLSNPARLRGPAFQIINRMQHIRPEHQVLGTAVALVAITETLNIDLSVLIGQAKRVLADVDGPYTEHIQAIRDFAANEMRRV